MPKSVDTSGLSCLHPLLRLPVLVLAAALSVALAGPASAQGGFEQTQQITAADAAPADEFAIAVASRGDLLIVGAHQDADFGVNSGSAYVYRNNGSSWILEQKLMAPDGEAYDRFGFSVGIDGNLAIVGAAWDDDQAPNAGAVHVFRHDGASWVHEVKLLATDGVDSAQLGFSVAISGNRVLAGATNDPAVAENGGAAYVFRFNGVGWVQDAKLFASDGAVNEYFGSSVGISGDMVVIGKYGDDDSGSSAGAAYIYRDFGSTWIEEEKLTASDGEANDLFGAAVAASGDLVVIGARHDDDNGTNAGAAYVFRRSGPGWNQEAKLIAGDGAPWDKFGRAVAVENDTIAIGAYWDDDGVVADSGSAYVFGFNGSGWGELANIRDAAGWFDDYFGGAMAVTGDFVFAGVAKDDDIGNNSGSLFVFSTDGSTGEPDCNNNGTPDLEDIASGASADCNVNGIPDECEDLPDCDNDGTPDACEPDCDNDGTPDGCETDCNANGTPDDCETLVDCNANGTPDVCESLPDCDNDGTPDDCEPDCDNDGTPDDCEPDCDNDGIPDDCEADCNQDGTPDDCEPDCDNDGTPDACEPDCNGNGTPDDCESFADCNANGTPDECDIASGKSQDANGDGVPDECQVEDCNDNGTPDIEDIASGASFDCNGNEIPDECEAGGGTLEVSSGPLAPIGTGSPQSFGFDDPPAAIGDVSLDFLASGDFGSTLEYIDVDINGMPVGRMYQYNAIDCADPPGAANLVVSAADFNAAINGSTTLLITLTASASVNATLCVDSFVLVNLSYAVEGIVDSNGNGIPDACEGDCIGDVNGDGTVEVEDVVAIVLAWGDCPLAAPCPADVTGDGEVDVDDLIVIVESWGLCQ